MDIVQGILSTAQAIGANPLDLATVISYETGGTFDPLQTGPTTQWGQHRGLIQFGEPQAQQYGVDWNDPLGSQLGPDGAVANYLRGSGYQPGMGLLDLYSTINAGAPGRYGATDANNGGAPGTVADKVNEQMAGHRANAERLLGQQMAATPQQGLLGTVSTSGAPERQPGIFDALLGKLPAPVASRLGSADWRDNMTLALAGMSMNPNQALIGGVQRRMDNRDEQRRLNESMQWLASQPGGEQYAGAIAAGMDPSQVFAAYVQSQQPQAPQQPIEINGQLVDPVTGQVIGDYRDPQSAMDPVVVGNQLVDRNTGTVIYTADTAQGYRLTTPEEEAHYGGKGQIGPDGKFYPLQANNNGITITNPDGTVMQIGGNGRPLTEGQSRDNVYATRAQGALETLNGQDANGAYRDTILTSRANQIAGAVPLGLGRDYQNPEYQVIEQASQEFLQAILRKDTGAAITAEEESLYGKVYLPQPGDSAAVIEAKRQARIRAVEAINSGMSPLQQLQVDQALVASGNAGTGAITTSPIPGGATRYTYDANGNLVPQ